LPSQSVGLRLKASKSRGPRLGPGEAFTMVHRIKQSDHAFAVTTLPSKHMRRRIFVAGACRIMKISHAIQPQGD